MKASSVSPAKEDRRGLAMVAALLAIFTTIFASNLPTPLYSFWQARWGFSSTALTAVFSIYVLGVVATLLTLGSLSDKLGRRQMMVPGLLFILGGAVTFMLAEGIYVSLPGRPRQRWSSWSPTRTGPAPRPCRRCFLPSVPSPGLRSALWHCSSVRVRISGHLCWWWHWLRGPSFCC